MIEIVPVSCGKKVVDEFTVQSWVVLDRLLKPFNVGPKSSGLVHVSKTNVAVGLVPPVIVRYEVEGRGDAALRRLRVLGHFATFRILPDGEADFQSHEPEDSEAHYFVMEALAMAVARVARKPRAVDRFLASPEGNALVSPPE